MRAHGYVLESNISKHNNGTTEIQWYKTHDVLYLDPKDNKYKIIQAWPAYSDNGDIMWTECSDDETILVNENIVFKILK